MSDRERVQRLLWPQRHIPTVAKAALDCFLRLPGNQHWTGAQWADVLDVMLDSDSHLEVTEPLYEEVEPQVWEDHTLPIMEVAITCFYADEGFGKYTPQMMAIAVLATINNNPEVTGS